MSSVKQIITLNCVFIGDSEDFTVDIVNDAKVTDLKHLIKATHPDRLENINAIDLELRKAFCSYEDLPLQLPIEGRPLRSATKLSIFRQTDLSEDNIHIVVALLSLDCFILGDPWHSIFTVEIPTNRNIRHLQDLIKKQKAHRLRHVDPSDLKLSSVPLALDYDAEEKLKTAPRQPLDPRLLLSQAFPGFKVNQLHVLIEAPKKGEEVSQVTNILHVKRDNPSNLRKRFEALVAGVLEADPPANSVKSGNYPKSQIAYSICDGRYAANKPRTSVAPPIELFNPAFGHFLDAMRSNPAVPEDMIRQTTDYMRAASAIYRNEEERRNALTPLLCRLIGVDIQLITNEDRTSPDGVTEKMFRLGRALLLLRELKNELGDGNSDPSTQAGLSLARAWAQARFESLRNASNCPTFLLATAGPWLVILGTVITDGVIVQRLTDYVWIGMDSVLNESHIARVARVFYALKSSLGKLDSFYDGIRSREFDDARFFPSITAYPVENGLVNFKYVGYLEDVPDCITLRAKTLTEPAQDIVVKFVERYGQRAHELLAKEDLAPEILFCGSPQLGADQPSYKSIRMVVMEYVHGSTLAKVQTDMDEEARGNVGTQVRRAIELLHSSALVFGDLRAPNVMVTKDDKVKLIDFNWAGEEGQATYPPMLSEKIVWPEGVRPLDVIDKKHDLEMLEKLI